MKVVITGSEGVVGGVLRAGLAGEFQIKALTRERQAFASVVADVRDFASLAREFAGAEAVIHLAAAADLQAPWEEILPANIEGTRQVFEAACAAGVARVVFASSGHVIGLAEERAGASLYSLADRRVFDEATPPEPDSLYAVSKVYGEALGRFYAAARGLSVVCVRLGAVLPDDDPRSTATGRGRSASMGLAERYPRLRAKWLSHRDCCQLFARCLRAGPLGFAIVYGTSNNPRQIWSLKNARNLLGYDPQDSAPATP